VEDRGLNFRKDWIVILLSSEAGAVFQFVEVAVLVQLCFWGRPHEYSPEASGLSSLSKVG
jgi:hypothetical protein